MEITLPTKPLEHFDDPNGLISLCTLSAINWGKIKNPKQFEKVCKLTVYALDALLDYQGYPLEAARNSTTWYRPLGVGVNDLAHFLAKRGLKYDQNALAVIDEYQEAMAYYLTKASVELAKKYGACGKVEHTKYADGIVPCDVRKTAVDELTPHVERMDWDSLRADLREYGIRNATLTACMPSECQSKDNKMMLRDGTIKTLGDILKDSGIDVDAVEKANLVGERFTMRPVYLPEGEAYQAYYNGVKPVYEVTFEDGSTYKFTGNHLLLVSSGGITAWKRVDEIQDGDQVLEYDSEREKTPH